LSRKKKQALANITIEAYAAEGKSMAHLQDGKVLFVENAIPGDVVDIFVTRSKKSWAEGRITALVAPSPLRVNPFCADFGTCGGCKWQMLPYEKQLQYKQQQVADQLQRIGHVQLPEMQPILGSPHQTYYRNKLEFTFSQHRFRTTAEIKAAGETQFPIQPAMGFHAPGLFDKVVEIDKCYLQNEPSNNILHTLRKYTQENNLEYYNFKAQYGWLRNVIIRVATTGQVLVNIIVHHNDEALKPMLDHLLQQVPSISSLHYTINGKVNDTIYDQEVILYHGTPFIEEKLENFTFKISPKSFFQTNTWQAERLYQVVRDFAGLTGTQTLYDLYCGTGSVGIFCSAGAAKVIGIEAVADAIADAKENAAFNKLHHCHFFCGDVAQVCNDSFFAQYGKPDVIICDPPRAGMHPDLLQQLLKMEAPKLVYVSCNPATQARDLQTLCEKYNITRLQPVDMFPHTHHIENVALLTLKHV